MAAMRFRALREKLAERFDQGRALEGRIEHPLGKVR